MRRRPQHLLTTKQRQQRSHERHDCSKWDAMESDFISSRLTQPARPTTPITTTTTTQPTMDDQTTGTTIRYSSSLNKSTVEPLPHQSIHIKHTRKKAATRVSHDTLILSETLSFPAQMQDHFISSGKRSERNNLINYVFALSKFPSPAREGTRPTHSGP